MKEKVGIIGGGSWGTALAQVCANNGHEVIIWCYEKEVARSINEKNENFLYHPGVKLHPSIKAVDKIGEWLRDVSFLISASPSFAVRRLMEEAKNFLNKEALVISATKGIEDETLMRMSEVIEDVLGKDIKIAVLSGPSFAREVIKGLPVAVTLASQKEEVARRASEIFHSRVFRTYIHTDVVGAEIGGALKNVIAIAVGISDGLGFGMNTRAALLTRGLHEIMKLGVKMGAKPVTFSGLSGMGDLVLTATGDLSRNRRVGLRLAKGEKLEDILKDMVEVAEGVRTAPVALKLARIHKVDMPITEEVNKILFDGKSPMKSVEDLMSREMKLEMSFFEGR